MRVEQTQRMEELGREGGRLKNLVADPSRTMPLWRRFPESLVARVKVEAERCLEKVEARFVALVERQPGTWTVAGPEPIAER